MWQYNRSEWPHGLMGCAGSLGLGFMMPGMAYCMSSIISVLYNPDPATMEREVCFQPGLALGNARHIDDILRCHCRSLRVITAEV